MDLAQGQSTWWARPTSTDDGLEDISWIHGLGGESLPADVLRYPPKPEKKVFFAIRDGLRNLVIRFVHPPGQLFFYHTPGQRPPHFTGHCVNTVTLGWVGAPSERIPFRINDAVVRFVDRCLPRTRNLAASN